MNRRKGRVLFIGLDAGDAELIEQWCQEGLLPNISRMKSRGTWARMRTTAEIRPCLRLALDLHRHRTRQAWALPCLCHESRPPGAATTAPGPKPFPFLWKLLSDQGKHCVIMDAFLTCPLQNFNGTQIIEWGTWSWFWEPTVLPVSLKRELQRKFGPYPAEDHSKVADSARLPEFS